MPTQSEGATGAQLLTDGVIATEGDVWKSNLTATLRDARAFVEYDLGSPVRIRAALLQGDNNDRYSVSGSEDGATFTTIWTAQPVGRPGLRTRSVEDLDATARYIRVSATGGDNNYSLTELQLFEQPPTAPSVVVRQGFPPEERVRSGLLMFALAAASFAFLTFRGSRSWWPLLWLLLPVLAGIELIRALQEAWPVGQREVALVRATAAGIAALAVLREAFAPRRFPADRRAIIAVLSLAAFMAIAGFFNIGHPQFTDHKTNKPSIVHNFDMRVYYPIGKYFKELRFDGLYLASVAAYVDDVPAASLDKLSNVELRDLKTHRLRKVGEVKGEIDGIRNRFSPERWEDFKKDMRYFRLTMGPGDYLGSMKDHGGNATPVWLTITQPLFRFTSASDLTLTIGAMLDPLLLLIAFLAIARTFGIRTMLISMVVFGANDFYMFGTNWAGATLRHDWMAYLAMGVCALKVRRFTLAGVLLALAAMIRAFPGMALIGVSFPFIWWLIGHIRANRKLPSLRLLRTENRAPLRVLVAAVIAVAGLFLFSLIVVTPHDWVSWYHKVSLLTRDPHVNDVSLRALIAGTDGMQHRILMARLPLFIAASVMFVTMGFLASRGRRLDQAALFGAGLIPVVFNPANYYVHFIFLIPLVAEELRGPEVALGQVNAVTHRGAGVWLSLLIVCVAQYWAVLVANKELHFQIHSALLFVGLTGVFVSVLRSDLRKPPWVAQIVEPSSTEPVVPASPPPAEAN